MILRPDNQAMLNFQEGQAPQNPDHSIMDHGFGEWISSFSAFDWVTQVLLVVLVGWILYLCRDNIKAFLPGRKK